MKELKEELWRTINSLHSGQELGRAKEVKGKIEELWRQEEMYLGMRFRINWLK